MIPAARSEWHEISGGSPARRYHLGVVRGLKQVADVTSTDRFPGWIREDQPSETAVWIGVTLREESLAIAGTTWESLPDADALFEESWS